MDNDLRLNRLALMHVLTAEDDDLLDQLLNARTRGIRTRFCGAAVV